MLDEALNELDSFREEMHAEISSLASDREEEQLHTYIDEKIAGARAFVETIYLCGKSLLGGLHPVPEYLMDKRYERCVQGIYRHIQDCNDACKAYTASFRLSGRNCKNKNTKRGVFADL